MATRLWQITDGGLLDCGHVPSEHGQYTTGYGMDEHGRRHCYECCAERDKAAMRENGRATLYFSNGVVCNWPGSLKIVPNLGGVRKSRNNWGAQRTDVWFTFEGRMWHGVNVGDNDILWCKRLAS